MSLISKALNAHHYLLGTKVPQVNTDFCITFHIPMLTDLSITTFLTKICLSSIPLCKMQLKLFKVLAPICYLAKSDIKAAFRIVSLHPSQYHLMGFKWRGLYYYDSSCKIFEAILSAILYILQHHFNIKDVVKVLDDFLFLTIKKEQCHLYLKTFLKLCRILGIPVAMENTSEEPLQRLVFLGILLDTIMILTQLPINKLVYTGSV